MPTYFLLEWKVLGDCFVKLVSMEIHMGSPDKKKKKKKTSYMATIISESSHNTSKIDLRNIPIVDVPLPLRQP